MKKALAINLRKVRSLHEQTQDATARFLKIKLSAYQAYEEGRAEPSAERLVEIADHFGITNLKAFISDPEYNPSKEYPKKQRVKDVSPLQANYQRLTRRDQRLVDILLGIRNIE